ncbi:MAG: DUF6065 family protein [Gemmatimonadales bacterium]
MKKKGMGKSERRLTAYRLVANPPVIRPGVVRKDWMDETPHRFAYRCLPLTIANTFGWEILSPTTFEATWNGGKEKSDTTITVLSGEADTVMSHFGSGVLTFHVGYLFRSEPGVSLMAIGSPNSPKDGIAPLAGVIETSWAPYPFTMNWRFTRPGVTIRFEQGEPFCFIVPVSIGVLETTRPEVLDISADAKLKARYLEWMESRNTFIKDLRVDGSDAQSEKWQKRYSRGLMPDGSETPYEHNSAVTVRPFADPQKLMGPLTRD